MATFKLLPWTALALCLAGTATSAEPSHARQHELLNLLHHDCGACHGLTLHGGLGPALTRDALAGQPAGVLRAVILDGRPATAMPPWRRFLSGEDVDWLVERLRRGDTAGVR